MPFVKGPDPTRNTNGRPKNAKGKISAAVKEALSLALKDEIDELPTVLGRLSDRDRAHAVTKLLPYVLPMLRSQELSIDATDKVHKVLPSWLSEGDPIDIEATEIPE